MIENVTTRAKSCRYCLLWAQGGPHGFKTRLLGEEEPLQRQEHSPIPNMVHYKHPLIQTQRPCCVPWDYGVKQTPTPRSRIDSNTICNNPLPAM